MHFISSLEKKRHAKIGFANALEGTGHLKRMSFLVTYCAFDSLSPLSLFFRSSWPLFRGSRNLYFCLESRSAADHHNVWAVHSIRSGNETATDHQTLAIPNGDHR